MKEAVDADAGSLELSRSQVEQLLQEADLEDSIEEFPYGSDLGSIVGAMADVGDWLEAAIASGHLPTLEGVVLALRGHTLITLKGGPGSFAQWAPENERRAALARDYRDIISKLERMLELLEDARQERPAVQR